MCDIPCSPQPPPTPAPPQVTLDEFKKFFEAQLGTYGMDSTEQLVAWFEMLAEKLPASREAAVVTAGSGVGMAMAVPTGSTGVKPAAEAAAPAEASPAAEVAATAPAAAASAVAAPEAAVAVSEAGSAFAAMPVCAAATGAATVAGSAGGQSLAAPSGSVGVKAAAP